MLRNLERDGDLAGLFGDLTGDHDFLDLGDRLNLFGDIYGESAILLDLWHKGDLLLQGTGDEESEEALQKRNVEDIAYSLPL